MVEQSKNEQDESEKSQSSQQCNYEGADWDPKKEVDQLLGELDDDEADLKEIATTAHQCLKAMSLNDACEFMTERNAPMTEENINKFLDIAQKTYLIRLKIMEDLVLNQ